jgi:hypothetical protein
MHHFKFGFGHGSSLNDSSSTNTTTSRVKRQTYGGQYFTSGGIDFIISDAYPESSVLSQADDYQQMLNQVECYVGADQDAAGHYWQVCDNNNHDTIGGGAVAPFGPPSTGHWSWITSMWVLPTPILTWPACT